MKTKFRTFSVVAGSLACNARCPFCVGRMTPAFGLGVKEPQINWDAFHLACARASEDGVGTVMFTSNGESTLFPDQITAYLRAMEQYNFTGIELQTNGILIAEGKPVTRRHLSQWRAGGIKTIAVSVVHYEAEKNRQIFLPHRRKYIDLPALIDLLHEHDFAVRLGCTMIDGFIDSASQFKKFLHFARQQGVEEVTARPVTSPTASRDAEAFAWISKHQLRADQLAEIRSFLDRVGKLSGEQAHGARIYDLDGQNVCLSNCLTVDDPGASEFRNLIFFPNGTITYDWQREDALVPLERSESTTTGSGAQQHALTVLP